MENLENMDWEAITPPENSEEEIKKIQKSLRKRNWKTILTSLVLVAALLLGIFCVGMPLAEKLWWSPGDSTIDQAFTDFQLLVSAYTELFMPGKSVYVSWGDTGFAEYELHVTLHDIIHDERQYLTGQMRKGNLSFDREMFDEIDFGLFRCVQFPEVYPEEALEREREEVRAVLSELPEYIRVEAAISFPEDLTMEQLLSLIADNHFFNTDLPMEVHWAAIRTQEPDSEPIHRTSGISFNISQTDGGVNELYPEFARSILKPDGANLEQHYKSLLKFSSDQLAQGHGVIKWVSYNYYEEALRFVEENGVKTYGCIITGTPKALLNLLDSGKVKDLQLMDGWIDVG